MAKKQRRISIEVNEDDLRRLIAREIAKKYLAGYQLDIKQSALVPVTTASQA